MKNPAPYLRQKLFALLDGNVSYDGNQVEVVEAGSGTEGMRHQIFIGEYSDSDRSNKNTFAANATQLIEVMAEQSDSTKKAVDAIGELVNDIIMPSPASANLNGNDFMIVVSRPSISHIVEDSGSGTKLVRLLLRYPLFINHN